MITKILVYILVLLIGAVGALAYYELIAEKNEDAYDHQAVHEDYEDTHEHPHSEYIAVKDRVLQQEVTTQSTPNETTPEVQAEDIQDVVPEPAVTPSLFIKNGGYGSAVITTDGIYRYITSDGIPEHEPGTFPNSGNPNAISAQDHDYKVPMVPVYKSTVTNAQLAGVALNGIPLEAGTGEFYNNDRTSGWNEEAFYNGVAGLGIDWSNAHVQPGGTYHYHATPEGLLETALTDQSGDMIHLAWAADGFPMYYSQSNAYSASYQVKSGTRPSGPGGVYDGKYTQDYEYVKGLGNLDECNGTYIDGEYVYIMTDSFPRITRCVHGTLDSTFQKGPDTGGQAGGSALAPEGQTGSSSNDGPPAEAITACSGKSSNSSCTVTTPQGTLSGTCKMPPNSSALACVPG